MDGLSSTTTDVLAPHRLTESVGGRKLRTNGDGIGSERVALGMRLDTREILSSRHRRKEQLRKELAENF